MSRKRKRPSRDPRVEGGIVRSEPPSKRLKPIFAVCQEVTNAADRAAAAAGPAHAGTQTQFERSFFMRGVNILKAAWVVAGQGYWEVAATCARQLFELVLNMEYIAKGENREPASIQFAMFGLLQNMQYELIALEYSRDTGRPYDEEAHKTLELNLAREWFDEFRITRKDGTRAWQSSWNGKTVYAMAKESSTGMRLIQYNTLFRRWSEEAHAAPGALVPGMFRISRDENWFEDVVAEDDREIVDVLNIAVVLFLELWMLVHTAVPLDAEQATAWMERLTRIMAERHGPGFEDYAYPRHPDGSYIIAPPATALTPEGDAAGASRT